MNQALKKFLEGRCSSEEALRIIKWSQSEEAEAELGQTIEEIWREHGSRRNDLFSKPEIYQKILAQIRWEEPAPATRLKTRKPFYQNLYFKIAASVLLLITAGIALREMSLMKEGNSSILVVDECVVKSASMGQKSTIFLPDGTKVRLNSGSEISFPSQLSGMERVVELTGEAFFDVASDPSRPFVVVSKDIETIALGTSFNVKAYPDDKEIMVSLATGKVKIKQKYDDESHVFELILDPGYQAIYNTSKNAIRKTEFDERSNLSWKDNILYFEDAEWEEIVNELEMWYGVKINIENEIYEDKLYSGEFIDASIKNVLESLSFTKNFTYRIHGNEVTINFIQQS